MFYLSAGAYVVATRSAGATFPALRVLHFLLCGCLLLAGLMHENYVVVRLF